MPTTFADFAAQQDAKNTIQLNVRKWTLMLCDALVDNFKSRNYGKVGGYDAPTYKFYPGDRDWETKSAKVVGIGCLRMNVL